MVEEKVSSLFVQAYYHYYCDNEILAIACIHNAMVLLDLNKKSIN